MSRARAAAVVLGLAAARAGAQPAPDPPAATPAVWLEVGAGLLGPAYSAIGASLAVETRPHRVWMGRATRLEEACFIDCAPDARLYEVGALHGWTAHSRWAGVTLAGGAALLTGWRERPGGRQSITTVGVPVELQLHLRPFRFLGIGLTGRANLNARASFGGALLGVHIGALSPSP